MYFSMYYITWIMLFIILVLKYYLVLMINTISYLLALPCYIFCFNRNKIISKNLKLVFNHIPFIKKQIIIINSYKNFVFNIIVVIVQYIFGNSFLYSYYNKESYSIYNKIQLILCHYGLFYDPSSCTKLFNRNICCIYKGNFNLYINKNIKIFKHNHINIILLLHQLIKKVTIYQKYIF